MDKEKKRATWVEVPYLAIDNNAGSFFTHHVCSSCHMVSTFKTPKCMHCGANMSKR